MQLTSSHPRTRPIGVGHLRAFEAVARHLNFRAAAEELSLTQSAVSRQIQALEDEVGTALFLRHTRAVDLTSAGAQLLRAATQSLEAARVGIRSQEKSLNDLLAHADGEGAGVLAEAGILLVTDEAERRNAGSLDDVQHLQAGVIRGLGVGLELKFRLDGQAQRLLQILAQRQQIDRRTVPGDDPG